MRYFSKSGFIISQTGEISLLRGLTSLPPALSKTPAAFSAPLKRFSHILPTSFFVRITVKVLGADHCISLFIKCLLYSQSFPECAIFLPRIRKNQVGIAIVISLNMKRLNIPFILAGLASLPVTHSHMREGSLLIAIGFICLIVAATLFIIQMISIQGKRTYLSFILGALTSEAVFFGYWGMKTGYDDGYGFAFNFQLMLIEFLAISFVGCIFIVVLTPIMKRMSKPSASL